MSDGPARRCVEFRCPALAVARGRCRACNARLEARRTHGDPSRLWYRSARWRDLRRLVLDAAPLCAVCRRAPATEVDHVRPHRGDEVLFWSLSNLQGLCAADHARKTRREFRGR